VTEVRVEGVTRRFGNVEALRGVDLTIASGEFLSLVGSSGCGKSTLLHVIAGLERASEGTVRFDGVDVSALSPRERDVAVVFQTYALYPHMSVFDNLGFPLRMSRVPREELRRRVRETAELLRIDDLLSRRPRELSGGQRQRVALGRAIVRRPRVFLFDEPLSNLDARLRLETRAELKRLHEQLRTTFIYVTHDQTEAMTLSQRLAVLRAGEVLQVGTPEEVYRRPADTFVATFVGSPPMNLIPARLDGGRLAVGGVELPAGGLPPSFRGDVLIGLRPEDLALRPGPGEPAMPATVTLVEPLGPESYVHLDFAGHALVARVGPDVPVRAGERLRVSLGLGAASLFDPETGRRLQT